MIYNINNLNFSYPQSSKNVLNDINFSVESGTVTTILGPNGTGKSTLLSLMTGILKPSNGSIELFGNPLFSYKEKEIARLVSLVPQGSNVEFDYTVFDYVLMGRTPLIPTFSSPNAKDKQAAHEALERLGIAHLADKYCTKISGGERQQAMLARAIVRKPKLIILDEPTAYLDFGNQLAVLKTVKSLRDDGYSVVMTTHNPNHAIMLGGNVAMLDKNGRLACGKCDDMMTESTLSDLYSSDIILRYDKELNRNICIYPNL